MLLCLRAVRSTLGLSEQRECLVAAKMLQLVFLLQRHVA